MIKSTPNVWYNIDDLYTITSNGTIELNVKMPNGKDAYNFEEEVIDLQSREPETESKTDCLSDCKPEASSTSAPSNKPSTLTNLCFPEATNSNAKRWPWICLLIIIFICFIISGWNTLYILFSHQTYPQQVTDYLPVSSIPFPAITICNEIKINKPVTANDNLAWLKVWELRQALCDLEIYDNPPDVVVSDDYVINKALMQFSPALVHFLHDCGFGDQNCFDQFHQVFTDDGLCFTFNGLNTSSLYKPDILTTVTTLLDENNPTNFIYGWSPESVYTKRLNKSSNMYPRFAASNKHDFTLRLMEKEDTDVLVQDSSCRGSTGYKVMIHDPATLPSTSTSKIVSISTDSETTISISAKLTTASDDVMAEFPDQYSCRHWNDQSLDYFNFYTKQNCIMECFVKFTHDLCHCVAFYMPRKNDTQVCTSVNKVCLASAYKRFFYNNELFDGCNCLPSCHQVSYDVSATNKYYAWPEYVKRHTYKSMSKVKIHFSDFHLTRKKYVLEHNFRLFSFAMINLIVLAIFCLLVIFYGISVIHVAQILCCTSTDYIKSKSNNKQDNINKYLNASLHNSNNLCSNGMY